MKLSEKGHFAPPPKLEAAAQQVSDTVASWDGVEARCHWLLGDETVVDGADFYFGEEEPGHLHLDSEAHVMLPVTVANAIVEAGLAERLVWDRSTVVFVVERPSDVEHASWLFGLSYRRREGAPTSELLSDVRDRAGARSRRS